MNAENIFVVNAKGNNVAGVQAQAQNNKVLVKAPTTGYQTGQYTLYIRENVKSVDGQQLVNTKMAFDVK